MNIRLSTSTRGLYRGAERESSDDLSSAGRGMVIAVVMGLAFWICVTVFLIEWLF